MIRVYLNVGIDGEFFQLMNDLGVDEYIKIPKAIGRLKGLEPMEDTHVWPGYFVVYEIPSDNRRANTLLKKFKGFADKYRDEGVCVVVHDVESIRERG